VLHTLNRLLEIGWQFLMPLFFHRIHALGLLVIWVLAVPWLRRLVPGLSPRRPGFDPRSVHVRFVMDSVALGQVFSPSTWVFSCQFHSTGAPLQGKTKELIIFVTGLNNKPQGCGASVASATRPFSTKEYKVWFTFFNEGPRSRCSQPWGLLCNSVMKMSFFSSFTF
jgi:hypothetical protein